MKRSQSILLTCLMVFSITASVFAEVTADGLFEYRVEKNGQLTITKYLGEERYDVIIPLVIEGIPVTRVENKNKRMKSIVIQRDVTKIGNGAFSGCTNVVSIEIPSTVTDIGEAAFEGCHALQKINIPECVKDISARTFSGCRGMSEIILPSSVKTIGSHAFDSSSFKSVILPHGLHKIESNAFANSDLETIVIPNSVNEIGPYAFSGCKKLTSVILPSGLKKIDWGMFSEDSALEEVAVPKSVVIIEDDAFLNCHNVSVWGFKGTYAETYAKKADIPFVAVDPVKDVSLLLNGADVTKEKLSIDLGSAATLQLSAQASPKNPWPGFTWKSSDFRTAKVDANGLVTGLKKGKTTVTATATDGSGKKASCEITVSTLVKTISITHEETVKAGKKMAVKPVVLPETASNKHLVWTTSDKTAAVVDAHGVITAKKVSEVKTVTITATAKDGSGVFAEFLITVVP